MKKLALLIIISLQFSCGDNIAKQLEKDVREIQTQFESWHKTDTLIKENEYFEIVGDTIIFKKAGIYIWDNDTIIFKEL